MDVLFSFPEVVLAIFALIDQTNMTKSFWVDSGAFAMRTVNIHEAKTHLSRLIDAAMKGESFIIAKAGRPMVRVSPITDPEELQQRRLGFLAGKIRVPEDFDRMGQDDIVSLFDGQV